jgi:nucleotide-binding universal stress UspA family protein
MKLFPPKSILAPTDLSELSLNALGYVRLFHEVLGSAVTVLHAEEIDIPPYFTASQADTLLRAAREARRQAVDEVTRVVTPVLGFEPTVRVVEGYPATVIAEIAARDGHDLIVLGTHGRRGVSRFFLGSVAERVLHASPSPVLVTRRPAPETLRRLLCAVTATPSSADAQGYAKELANAFSAELHVLQRPDEVELRNSIRENQPDIVVMDGSPDDSMRRIESALLFIPPLRREV